MTLGELEVGNVHVMHCALDLLNPPFIARARAAGHLIHASNCDTRDQLERAYRLGVDRLSTTRLRLALKVRAEHGAR